MTNAVRHAETVISLEPLGFKEHPGGYGGVTYNIRSDDLGEIIGEVWLGTLDTCANYYSRQGIDLLPEDIWPLSIELMPNHLGKGLGLQTYLAVADEALRTGRALRSDPEVLRPAAKRVWDKLVKNGFAICEVTPRLDEAGDYVDGTYRMTP
jgi:hypothetical protein